MRPAYGKRIVVALVPLLLWIGIDRVEGRRIPIPIVFGTGEKIDHVGNPDAEIRKALREESGRELAVGYIYSSFKLFWIDFWTWNGRYCLYEGDRYSPLEANEAAELLGLSERELPKPWLYSFPPGVILVAAIVLVCIVRGIRSRAMEKQFAERIQALFNDSRYQKALEVLQKHAARSEEAAPASEDQADETDSTDRADETETSSDDGDGGFGEAVELLVKEGVDREEAAQNLALMIHVLQSSHGSAA